MCGIVGKLSFAKNTVTEADIVAMNRCVTHRGPDDSGVYISPNQTVGLGHQRLSIIDTSAKGHQPMQYLNRYWIVFNGEIYNFQELKKDLEENGYSFTSGTDTEVILALYDKYQEHCLEYLVGMFSFALYDSQEEKLFCARDRFGQKPFKYFFNSSVFIFGSELKSILTQPEYKKEPDWSAIHDYLTYQYIPSPATGFKGIQKLEPGTCLTIDIKKGTVSKKKYWQQSFEADTTVSKHEWQRRIKEKLTKSVESQMIADVPLGAFLSGGIDSSIIVGLMSKIASKPVKTFSIGFAEEKLNELKYAKQVAKHFSTDHQEFIVKPETIELLPELVSAYEEPYADSSAIPTYYLSKLTRQHVTVALTGDGGDELFAGYSRYSFHKLALLLDSLHLSKLPLKNLTNIPGLKDTTFGMRAGRFLESLSEPYAKRYVNYLCYFTNSMKDDLYRDEFKQVVHHDSRILTEQSFKEAGTSDKIAQALYCDAAMYLADDLLTKVDIASMMVGLEARSPFLDHEFAETVAKIPTDYKLKGFTSRKHILKETFSDMLPAEIIHRKKMGFILPIETWFRGDLQEYVDSLLLSDDTKITQFIAKKESVKKLLHTHRTTSVNLAPPIWSLMTLELWLRKYFP